MKAAQAVITPKPMPKAKATSKFILPASDAFQHGFSSSEHLCLQEMLSPDKKIQSWPQSALQLQHQSSSCCSNFLLRMKIFFWSSGAPGSSKI